MWPFSIIPYKRPPNYNKIVVRGMAIGGGGLGVILAETQVPRHSSVRSLHLHIQKFKIVKK